MAFHGGGILQPVKILLAHNTYQWPGGEDTAFELDAKLLEDHGHEVIRYVKDNDAIEGLGISKRARVAGGAFWAVGTKREVAALIAKEKPDVAHFHNTFPLISPSAFAACRDAGVPVVLTVQNYRFACVNAFLFRDGRVCEDCLHRTVKWPGVLHACYRDSRTESAVVAGMLTAHRWLRTWSRLVDVFLTVSQFGRDKLVEAGLPADKVVIRPNFAYPDPGDRAPGRDEGFALFAGRLSPEKGLDVLLDAWSHLDGVPLRVIGDGPLRDELRRTVAERQLPVELLGPRSRAEVLEAMRAARLMAFPSKWYEHFPFVLVEAFASGLPVVASALGAMNEIAEAGGIAFTFPAGDSAALADRVTWAWTHPEQTASMGRRARAVYEQQYTGDIALARLLEIYERARAQHQS